ncbi:uncharacterized protein F5891DRAFT_309404 [Suillus fuscotomentosus]|uniref:Uncharacterized protein n=1 Tax=Suillus fuscotomentosus TaxID=1912939 RepID=A0AAD4E6K3_9AGAM|nr:uncharacterized protein F5891DRAFT_309404 [Suillus fuscotomentosus]KAG1900302.1 hypothetical protein F5891DRAFT_309404 [Suillus fuscotomentosus]
MAPTNFCLTVSHAFSVSTKQISSKYTTNPPVVVNLNMEYNLEILTCTSICKSSHFAHKCDQTVTECLSSPGRGKHGSSCPPSSSERSLELESESSMISESAGFDRSAQGLYKLGADLRPVSVFLGFRKCQEVARCHYCIPPSLKPQAPSCLPGTRSLPPDPCESLMLSCLSTTSSVFAYFLLTCQHHHVVVCSFQSTAAMSSLRGIRNAMEN